MHVSAGDLAGASSVRVEATDTLVSHKSQAVASTNSLNHENLWLFHSLAR